MVKKRVVIRSKHGLHARPSARICETAQTYGDTIIKIVDPDTFSEADAKSILSILTMTKENGQEVVICAEGPDEQKAATEVARIIEEFDV